MKCLRAGAINRAILTPDLFSRRLRVRRWRGCTGEGNGGEEGSFGANGKHVEWNSPLLADDHFLNVRVHAHIAAGEPPSVGR